MNGLFDAYVIVDWSAASVPKTGRDSIWIVIAARDGPAGSIPAPTLVNPATRAAATAWTAGRLADLLAGGRRVLVGVDFPLGYPRGTARRLGLSGPPWRATWDRLAEALEDAPDNRNNRFAVAADLNRRLTGGPAPFWGCPPGAVSSGLSMRRPPPAGLPAGLEEWRLTDRRARGVQPIWKLYTTGSVGSQALTGIPRLRAWRDDPRLSAHAAVWPFETGLTPPGPRSSGPPLVFAEVWPSLLKEAWRARHAVKDAGQVLALASHLAALDAVGDLAPLFAASADFTTGERAAVEAEEGWILGVV